MSDPHPSAAVPASGDVLVALSGVSKRHPDGTLALDDVSLTLPPGRVLVLLGTSGAGKTTALKTINAIVRPDSGRVVVLGRPLEDWDPIALRRRIGWVIQEVGLLPHMSISDNVALVPRLLGWDAERCRERVQELLALVGLDPGTYASRRPAQLSGGERQRVGLARALAARPPLLLMDEPFGSLDPLTRRRMQDEFRDLQRRLGTAAVLVTHDIAEALRLGDEVLVMHHGRVVQSGSPDDLRERPEPGFVQQFMATALL